MRREMYRNIGLEDLLHPVIIVRVRPHSLVTCGSAALVQDFGIGLPNETSLM